MSNQSEEIDSKSLKVLGSERAIEGLGDAVLVYNEVDDFTTFYAKYTMKDDDIVVHFYPNKTFMENAEVPVDGTNRASLLAAEKRTSEVRKQWPLLEVHWTQVFPAVLNDVAQEHFQATTPRLMAKYTYELFSWWMCGRNYSHIIDLDMFMRSFFEKLDRSIDRQRQLSISSRS